MTQQGGPSRFDNEELGSNLVDDRLSPESVGASFPEIAMGFPLPQFSLRWLMAAVAVTALALVHAQLTTFLLLAGGAIVAFRSLIRKRQAGSPRSWAGPYLVALACLYLPFAWVLWDFPWDDYRWHWIKLWPILPGLVVGMFAHPNDRVMELVSGAVAVLLVAVLTAIGSSGRATLLVASGLTLVGAALESWLAYQLYLW